MPTGVFSKSVVRSVTLGTGSEHFGQYIVVFLFVGITSALVLPIQAQVLKRRLQPGS
jgi:hypothetical protein